MNMQESVNFEQEIAKTGRYFTYAYIGSLALLGALFAGAVFQFMQMNKTQNQLISTSQTIERQSALAPYVTLLASEYLQGTELDRIRLRKDIENSLQEMVQLNKDLTRGNPDKNLSAVHSDEMDSLLYDDPVFLDEKVRRYVNNARDFINASPMMLDAQNPNLVAIKSAILFSFLDALHTVRERAELETELKLRSIERYMWAFLISMVVVLVGLGALVFHPLLKSTVQLKRDLFDLAMIDPLTNANNRRSFMTLAEREFDRVRRYKVESCVIGIDIDHFKKINDTYGHPIGDEVIKSLVNTAKDQLRKTDFIGRLGGEEFNIILPETDLDGAQLAAEKIRKRIEELTVYSAKGNITYTASFGVSSMRKDDQNLDEAMARTDKALYQAKESGRNQVCCS